MQKATIKTEKGDMTVEFFPEDAPGTVKNFPDINRAMTILLTHARMMMRFMNNLMQLLTMRLALIVW